MHKSVNKSKEERLVKTPLRVFRRPRAVKHDKSKSTVSMEKKRDHPVADSKVTFFVGLVAHK